MELNKMKNIFKMKKRLEAFTLVEVVASLLILAIAVLGIMSLFPVGIRAVTNANDTATATMLAQLKISQLLYGRPNSLFGEPGNTQALICWDGSSYNAIVWDTAGWTYDSSSAPYPFKDNPKFYWAAYRQRANESFQIPSYDAIDDLYRVDLFIFKKERLPTAFNTRVPAFARFSVLFAIANPYI